MKALRATLAGALAVTLLVTSAGAAAAGDAPRAPDQAPAPGWFLPVGLNLGGAIELRRGVGSFIIGAEISAAYLFGTAWLGVYGDGLFDAGPEVGRVSAGVEAGWFLFGAELGYTVELDGADATHGLRLGGLVSGSVLGGYLRWVHLPGHASPDRLEIGVLLKWPFAL